MQTWVDFAAIKQNVGLAPVLRRYQVSLRRSGRDQYRGLCPIHRDEGRVLPLAVLMDRLRRHP